MTALRKVSILTIHLLIGMLFASTRPARADCPPCGPTICVDTKEYQEALKKKKAELTAKGYPADLVALLDLDGPCLKRVTGAPDGFSIRTVAGNNRLTIAWSKDNERIAREQLEKGTLTAYYKFNVDRAFACCKEKKHDERPDWDPDLGLNKGLVITCTKSGEAVECKKP